MRLDGAGDMDRLLRAERRGRRQCDDVHRRAPPALAAPFAMNAAEGRCGTIFDS
jgi:hypothetical protein